MRDKSDVSRVKDRKRKEFFKMREVHLNNGVMMPSVGFGVYQIAKSETMLAVLKHSKSVTA